MSAQIINLPTVESRTEEISGLVYERQTMRSVEAPRDELERNRLELVTRQQQLVDALIRRYLPADLNAA